MYRKILKDFKKSLYGSIKYQTLESYSRRLEKVILPYFEENNRSLLSREDIYEWQQYLSSEKQYKIGYINTLRNTLNKFINFAVEHNYLEENVTASIPRIKDYEPEESFDYWEFEEFQEFIRYAETPLWKTYFTFLYFTGCRIGESRAITWKQIDFRKERILINRSISKRPDETGRYVISTPKNNRYRYLKMNSTLKDELMNWKNICRRLEGFKETNFVFYLEDPSVALTTSTIERRKNKFCAESGVKQIRIHDFRHSNASLLINMGAPVSVVSERLGHKDKRQTLNIYSHFFPSAEDEIIRKIDELNNIYVNTNVRFAKALVIFLNSTHTLDNLGAYEKEIIDFIKKRI